MPGLGDVDPGRPLGPALGAYTKVRKETVKPEITGQ